MGLPLQVLPLPSQRYSCHGCGDCCRDFTVQLSREDLERLERQRWSERLGEPVTIEFRGALFLRQRDDGACIFLQADGLCRVHGEFGFDEKPLACRIFPFSFAPQPDDVRVGISFACQSVRENRGAALGSHLEDLRRFQRNLPQAQRASRVRLAGSLDASDEEVHAVTSELASWLERDDVPFRERLDGLAWFAQQLMAASLERVRGARFRELVQLLVGALPQELAHHPIGAPTKRQGSLLRQAVFARTEDPKLAAPKRRGKMATVLSQLVRSRRFSRGRGRVPPIGLAWPRGATFEAIKATTPPGAGAVAESGAIEELIVRWLLATLLGGRAWGSGFYGWPMVDGIAALALNLAAVGWLARAHAAAARSVAAPTSPPSSADGGAASLADARAAIGRIDRSAGRAPWLGGNAERLRLEYLARHDGLRRLVRESWFGATPASASRA
ncbi:MAG: YkgJ family cysteine cluster protein [Phycisphaerae bacterium]|nr:YkgJ family cysteine cluster protein [Phycisphaerae bacterium]